MLITTYVIYADDRLLSTRMVLQLDDTRVEIGMPDFAIEEPNWNYILYFWDRCLVRLYDHFEKTRECVL